eukprot:g1144.t1
MWVFLDKKVAARLSHVGVSCINLPNIAKSCMEIEEAKNVLLVGISDSDVTCAATAQEEEGNNDASLIYPIKHPQYDLVFRKAAIHDVPALKELHNQLFPVKYSDKFYVELLTDKYVTLLIFLPLEQGGRMIGLSTCRVSDSKVSCRYRKEGYIATFGIHPDFRRLRLGLFLLQETCALLRQDWQCNLVSLHVKVDNQAAITMYRKAGFTISMRMRNHYFIDQHHWDAFLLEKPLDQPNSVCAIL